MTSADRVDWRSARAALERLRGLPRAQREPELLRLSRREPAVAAEVRQLLAADTTSSSLLDRDACSLHSEGLLRDECEELIGREVAGYRLVEWIGLGGSAAVLRGEDPAGDSVAVKVLRRGSDSQSVVARFRQEHAITRDFDHLGLVRVLGAGEIEPGRPYLITEFVDGQPIDRYCDDRGLDRRARLELFHAVCRAVHHAHRHLVVHRDLKPNNILVEHATARPRVLDFGIAKLLDDDRDPGWTELYGRGPLTLAYASPEQVRGGAVTTASDVYSLGVLLYRLLVGRSPYRADGDDRVALERAVVSEPPLTPGEAGGTALPRDLVTVLMHCLHKRSEDRYPSAEHLADDVQRHLEHRPVRARRGRWHESVAKFVRRRPLTAAAIAAAVSLLVGGWAGARHNLAAVRASESVAWRAHADAVHATNTLAGVLESIAARGDPSPADLDRLLADAERHADGLADAPEAESRLRLAIARALQGLGAAERAVSNARRALALSRDTRGLTWRDTDRCLALLVDLLAADHPSEAAALAAERVALLREHFEGADDRVRQAEAALAAIRAR